MPATSFPLLRLFFGLNESQVLAIRDRAVALITEGKTIMQVQSRGGQMSQKQFALPPDRMLFEANAALKHINPRRYGRRAPSRTYARLSSL